MRLHPPTTILVLVALGAFALVALKPPVAASEDERCAVASGYVEAVVDDGVHLEGEKPVILGPTGTRMHDIAEYLKSEDALPSHKANPLLPLYREQVRTNEVSILEKCPDFLDRFERISATNDVYQPSIAADGSYENIYFSLSLPAISENGDVAVLDAGFVYAELAGGGVHVLMMKDKTGHWRIVSERGTWVS